MANSYAYVLSANKYPDAFQANLIGAQQGTIIVYAAAETLSSGDVLFTDSKLTQPVYGDPGEWYGVQLLTNTSVKYPITIGEDNEIVVGSGTTTTTAGPTTTTTAAPTTTTTAAPTTTTTAAPTTTTTTTAGSVTVSANFSTAQCASSFMITPITYPPGVTNFCDATTITSDGLYMSPNPVWIIVDGFTADYSISGNVGTRLSPCTSCG